MKRTLLLPILSMALGCDGRYILGDLHDTELDSNHPDSNSGPSGATAGDAGAADGGGESSTGLHISPTSVPNAIVGAPYAVTFVANGGVPRYAFRISSGALPTGLSLDPNGQLSGTPREQGAFSFVLEAKDAANITASASFQIHVSHTHWLASNTNISTSFTKSALSFVDLLHPQADPVLVEDRSAIPLGFSSNGQFYLYASYHGPSTNPQVDSQYDYYLVNTAGEKPGQPQFLLTASVVYACDWAPDSSKLACFKDAQSPDGPTTEVVYFDTTQSAVGPERSIEPVPPRTAGAKRNSEREMMFLDGNTLVYSYGPNDFARVEWTGQTPSAPELLGVGGGTIDKQSSDGGRALVERTDTNYPPTGRALVDFRAGTAQVLDPNLTWFLSDGFEAGLGLDAPAADDRVGTYSYYALDGISVNLVGQEAADALATIYLEPQIAGRTVVRQKGDRVALITVGNAGVIEQVVPGDYQGVRKFKIDPAQKWLYIGTADVDARDQPIPATARHWLSRLGADGPAPAQRIDQGYSTYAFERSDNVSIYWPGNVLFSPDSQRLVLHGPAYPAWTPIALRLFDLRDPAQITGYDVDLSLPWADATWSSDSTYLSVIGGSPGTYARSLSVVDAFVPTAAPRAITECNPRTASAPTCPNLAEFQP